MLTGAVASSYYGTPRTTADVDVVVKVSKEDSPRLLFEPLRKAEVRVNERKIKQALNSGYEILTVRDRKSSLALDIILSDRKLEKRAGTIFGLPTFYQAPEELILAKLRMIKVTVSPERTVKDKDDIRAILKHTKVDLKTIEKRAKRENTLSIFKELDKKNKTVRLHFLAE